LHAAVLAEIGRYGACCCREITEWKRPGQMCVDVSSDGHSFLSSHKGFNSAGCEVTAVEQWLGGWLCVIVAEGWRLSSGSGLLL
jgi:hypothetical protein